MTTILIIIIGAAVVWLIGLFVLAWWSLPYRRVKSRPAPSLQDRDTLDRRIAECKATETPLCAECPLHEAAHELAEERKKEQMARKSKLNKPDTIVRFKKNSRGKWNYTVVNKNGNKIFWSTQGYNNTADALKALTNAAADISDFSAVYEGLQYSK